MPYTLKISKDRFKFSSAHFTVFSESEFEKLHGHNYAFSLELSFAKVDELDIAAPFSEIKKSMNKICRLLDETVLIAEHCPFLRIEKEETGAWISLAHKKYFFPLEDLIFLPLFNITSESLARHCGEQLRADLKNLSSLETAVVTIEETRGQSASYKMDFI